MGGRAGGGARGAGGAGGGARNDFAREFTTHPMYAQMLKKDLDLALASIDASIKDPKMRAEMKAIVERMHKEMGGIPSNTTVKLGTSKDVSANGRPKYWFGVNQGGTITLNKQYFGKGYDYANTIQTKRISNGTTITTNKPALSTFVHELGHGYYNRLSSSGKSQVDAVFSQFKSSGAHNGWGSHPATSAKEFYADAVAKSVLGGSDKWTKSLGRIN